MDCREFLDRHLAFVDGTLSEVEVVAMHRHMAECEQCARHDMAIRRGLVVLRNLPRIEPSSDFRSRLDARIRELHQADARAATYRGPGVGSFMAASAGVIAAGFLAAVVLNWTEPARDLRLAPVVAMRPAEPQAPPALVDQTFVVSATSALPLWPAAVFAEQAPVHFANLGFALAGGDSDSPSGRGGRP